MESQLSDLSAFIICVVSTSWVHGLTVSDLQVSFWPLRSALLLSPKNVEGRFSRFLMFFSKTVQTVTPLSFQSTTVIIRSLRSVVFFLDTGPFVGEVYCVCCFLYQPFTHVVQPIVGDSREGRKAWHSTKKKRSYRKKQEPQMTPAWHSRHGSHTHLHKKRSQPLLLDHQRTEVTGQTTAQNWGRQMPRITAYQNVGGLNDSAS